MWRKSSFDGGKTGRFYTGLKKREKTKGGGGGGRGSPRPPQPRPRPHPGQGHTHIYAYAVTATPTPNVTRIRPHFMNLCFAESYRYQILVAALSLRLSQVIDLFPFQILAPYLL